MERMADLVALGIHNTITHRDTGTRQRLRASEHSPDRRSGKHRDNGRFREVSRMPRLRASRSQRKSRG